MQHVIMIAALMAPLAAQTFIVDAAGGAGAQFTSIATAIASVPGGAVLRVRSGVYGQFAISTKDVTILCEPGTIVSVQASASPPVAVRDLTANQQVAIRGLRVVNILGGLAFDISNCAGTVVLDACSSTTGGGGGYLQIGDSRDVRIVGCVFSPLTALACSCTNSTVRVANSTFVGTWFPTDWTGSVVELADTSISGGLGFGGFAPVQLNGSTLRVLDGCNLTASSGPVIGGTGSVRIDPGTTLSTSGGASPFAAGVQVTTQTMPTVAASTDSQGGVAIASLRGPVGGIGALYLGLPGQPTVVPPLVDAILLAPSTENLQAFGVLGPSLSASYAVPPLPLLLGVRVAWQGATADAASGVQVSNAVTYVHW
jgi:hypothetical protein